jgi:hypothetical protein
MPAALRNLSIDLCVLIGQSGHWAWLAATTALLLPAVAHSVNFPSVSFLRLRTGALDLLRPLGLAKAQWPVSEWSSRLTESVSARSSA